MICIRHSLAATFIALAVAGCGGGGGTPTSSSVGPGLVFLGDGTTLRAATITSTGYTETGSAVIPAAGLAANHQIFGVVVHPSKQWIYVASEADRDWGNARLSRFSVNWSTGALTYVDGLDLSIAGAGPSCADSDNCAPVGVAITADGTRLIVEDNELDTFVTYAIASDGSLSFLNQAAPSITQQHGVGINAAGTHLYHGSRAYSRAADVITDLGNGGTDGNASIVLNVGGVERLYTALDQSQFAVLALTDPANPTVIAQAEPVPGASGAVAIAVSANGSRIIAIGDNSVAVYDFDGAALTLRSQLTPAGVRARGVAFNADASLAVVAFQTGGAKLYTVATDGTLAEVGAVPSANPTRAVVFSQRP